MLRYLALAGGVTLIDDSYNANPVSVRAALDDLAATAEHSGHVRRVAVLGDMLELGAREREFHADIARHVNDTGVDVLITVGPLAATMADGFRSEVHSVVDASAAVELLPELLAPGDVVLVKASRGVGLELVCRRLAAVPAR